MKIDLNSIESNKQFEMMSSFIGSARWIFSDMSLAFFSIFFMNL